MNNPKESSLDKSEIAKFDALSGEWENPKGKFKILHDINPLRLAFIMDKIKENFGEKPLAELTALDVGCGGGLVSLELAKAGLKVKAIDASEGNIKIAQKLAEKNNLNVDYSQSAAEDLPDIKFDLVLCLEVIEHVSDTGFLVKNLLRLVKEDGALIVSTINRNIKSYLLGIVAAEYILGWVPKNTHEYSKFLKPSELNSLLKKKGAYIKELKGLSFDPVRGSWNLSEDISVNYFAHIKKTR